MEKFEKETLMEQLDNIDDAIKDMEAIVEDMNAISEELYSIFAKKEFNIHGD